MTPIDDESGEVALPSTSIAGSLRAEPDADRIVRDLKDISDTLLRVADDASRTRIPRIIVFAMGFILAVAVVAPGVFGESSLNTTEYVATLVVALALTFGALVIDAIMSRTTKEAAEQADAIKVAVDEARAHYPELFRPS